MFKDVKQPNKQVIY